MELEKENYDKIQELCSRGDSLTEQSLYDDAILKYLEALSFVPNNKSEWEASTWIYAALGDTCFLKRDFERAKEFLLRAYMLEGYAIFEGEDIKYINIIRKEV